MWEAKGFFCFSPIFFLGWGVGAVLDPDNAAISTRIVLRGYIYISLSFRIQIGRLVKTALSLYQFLQQNI